MQEPTWKMIGLGDGGLINTAPLAQLDRATDFYSEG